MKVSINWLKELVEINKPFKDLLEEINMKTIGTKEVTDKFIELDMKGYNRTDLLSLRGVAYEVASLLDSKVKFKEESDFDFANSKLPEVDLEIKDPEASPFYAIAKIEGLKVEASAADIKHKLEDSGYRAINNLADITNLVMLEYGQPLHSFDASTVSENKIIVRKAKPGEKIVTLDSKERELTEDDLLITDPKKAVGIAGVMGGENSEVTNKTTSILLEAAIFNPQNLRKTSTRLGLQSEASKRFYHGLTKIRLMQALNAAIKEYEKLGGKLTAITLVGNFEDEEKEIHLRVEKANSLIGLDFTEEQISQLLTKLNFKVKEIKPRVFNVTRPYFRLDVNIEEDLIEEVARLYGYDKIPSKALGGETPEEPDQTQFQIIDSLKKQLMHQGMSEVRTYSFYSTLVLESLGFDDLKKKLLVKVANPISKETEYMRMNIWPNLAESAVFNNKSFEDVAIFEIGKTFFPGTERPDERLMLGVGLIDGTDNPVLELVKIVYQTFASLEIEIDFAAMKPPAEAKDIFHPLRFLSITHKGKLIGGIAELHPAVADKLGAKKKIAVAEINLDKLQ